MRLVNCNDGDCISSVLSGAVLPSEKGGFVLKCFLLSPVLIKKKKKTQDRSKMVSDIYNIAIL